MTFTNTDYCGLDLRSPILVGACPMNVNSEYVRQFVLSGAGGIVLPSLFEEQVTEYLSDQSSFAAAEDDCDADLKEVNEYNGGVQAYLRTVARLKRQVGIPIFASLHGNHGGSWLEIGKELQSAGVDALEVNFDAGAPDVSSSADESECQLLEMVTQVCDQVTIPVSVKISPYHSNISNLNWRLVECGAVGMVCFSTEPTWTASAQKVAPTPTWNLNAAHSLNRTIAGLARATVAASPISLAASGGICTAEDAIKAFMAGANVVMMTSEIYRSGPDAIAHMYEGLVSFIRQGQYTNLREFQQHRPAPSFDRQSVVKCITQNEK